MLGRILFGAGASASAMLASTHFMVAHAQTPESIDDIPPVYDDEVPSDPAPLPGYTAVHAVAQKDTKLAEAETELAKRLETEKVEAGGRVYRVSKLLQDYIGSARELLDKQLQQAEAKGQVWSHKYREGERNAAATVASLKSEHEELLPESIYVLIAGLSGSILVRRRNFLLRATVPWVFGGAAFAYFLPRTWSNVRKLAGHYEEEQFPSLAKQHTEAQASLNKFSKETRETYDHTKEQAKSTFNSVREQIRAWIGV